MAGFEKTVKITNRRGLHARAAAKFVKIVAAHGAAITVTKDDVAVGGASIMGLLMLSASQNTAITISAEGQDAERALQALVELVEQRFGEDA